MVIYKVNKDNTLSFIWDWEENIPPKGYKKLEKELPYSIFNFYKLEENKIIPDNQKNLEKAKQVKLKEIKEKYEAIENNGYTCSNNIKMNSTFNDILKLKNGLDFYKKYNMFQCDIVDFYNNNHIVTLDELEKMLEELSEEYLRRWKAKVKLRKEVMKMNDIDSILNFEIEF